MAHQATLPMRETPHPNEISQKRWPEPGWQRGRIDPRDARRHAYDFGYRQLRIKQPSGAPQPSGAHTEVPEMTLDEVSNYLTKRYGCLKKAFDSIAFFKDGQLSAIEWQEGVYNTLSGSFGNDHIHHGDKAARMAIVPRRQFNEQMQRHFRLMDNDRDGLINFEELSRPYVEPQISSHNFTQRRGIEWSSHKEENKLALQRKMLTGTLADRKLGPPDHHQELVDPTASNPLQDFAVYLLRKFKDVDAAFAAFDIGDHGQLNMTEFVDGAKRNKYAGNARELFSLLDEKDAGTICKKDLMKLRQLPAHPGKSLKITQSTFSTTLPSFGMSMSRKDETMARRARSPIKDPGYHTGGNFSLASSDIRRPLGEKMRTSSSFYTIPRVATGRLDPLQHPNHIPGEDAEQFSSEHGPGFVEKGPEYFPEFATIDHPRRGDSFKIGASLNRVKRFSLDIPSKQAQADRDLSGMSFITYEGRRPADGYRVCGTGGIAWSKSPVRPGVTIR